MRGVFVRLVHEIVVIVFIALVAVMVMVVVTVLMAAAVVVMVVVVAVMAAVVVVVLYCKSCHPSAMSVRVKELRARCEDLRARGFHETKLNEEEWKEARMAEQEDK